MAGPTSICMRNAAISWKERKSVGRASDGLKRTRMLLPVQKADETANPKVSSSNPADDAFVLMNTLTLTPSNVGRVQLTNISAEIAADSAALPTETTTLGLHYTTQLGSGAESAKTQVSTNLAYVGLAPQDCTTNTFTTKSAAVADESKKKGEVMTVRLYLKQRTQLT